MQGFWYISSKYIIATNHGLVLLVVAIILGYSILTADYSHAQKIIPSISSTIDNSSNSSNNTQQIIEEEFGEDVQKNQQSTVLEQQQLQQPQALPSVKITSHTQNQEVPAGTLTIKGISSDTPSEWQY